MHDSENAKNEKELRRWGDFLGVKNKYTKKVEMVVQTKGILPWSMRSEVIFPLILNLATK
jgi:hypothetical protein